MLIVLKHEEKENTRNLQKTEGRREENIIHLNLRAPQILSLIHQNQKVIQTHLYHHHHLILVLQVMIGIERGRNLLNETNINVQKEEIGGVRKSERGVIRDPSAGQEGYIRDTC